MVWDWRKPAAVTDHQPAMRTQHRQVIRNVLRVGRTDANVDQCHAVTIFWPSGGRPASGNDARPRQRQSPEASSSIHALVDDRRCPAAPCARNADHLRSLLQAMNDELIDVTVIVGQQNPRLHMPPVAAGVMHQPTQREIDSRRIEQRQRQRIGVFPSRTGHRQCHRWQRTDRCSGNTRANGCRCDARAGQFIALLDHVRIRNILLADTRLRYGHGEVAASAGTSCSSRYLRKAFRMGDGDAVSARQLHLGVSAGSLRYFAVAEVGQTQLGVTKQRALLGVRLDAVLEIHA
jgi:hypothetical protein